MFRKVMVLSCLLLVAIKLINPGYSSIPGNTSWIDRLEAFYHAQEPDSVKIKTISLLIEELPLYSRDSTEINETLLRLNEIQAMYDRIRNGNEQHLLMTTDTISMLNNEKQRILRIFFVVVVLIILIFMVILIWRLRALSKTKDMLEQQKLEIEMANARLMEVNAMRDKLFSVISHDLRNPFASIVSFSRMMKRDIDQLSHEEIKELVSDLDGSVIRINDLLDNLLQWSRAQSGKLVYVPAQCRIDQLIESDIQLFQPAIDEKGIEVVNESVAGLTAFADENLTGVIVRNLLSNAIKFTEPGGMIRINTWVVRDEVHVCISDSGIGIEKEEQADLLSSDKILTTEGTAGETGSGLGLLICREFAVHQGGKIWFTSEKGVGSDFYFSLPLNKR